MSLHEQCRVFEDLASDWHLFLSENPEMAGRRPADAEPGGFYWLEFQEKHGLTDSSRRIKDDGENDVWAGVPSVSFLSLS